jgi:hypothetical protein
VHKLELFFTAQRAKCGPESNGTLNQTSLCFLPVVLYGCETWSLTVREEHRLGVYENRLLRRIFGPKSGRSDRRKLHNEELHDLYSSPSIIRIIKRGG